MGGEGCYVVGSRAPAITPKQLNTVTAQTANDGRKGQTASINQKPLISAMSLPVKCAV